MELVVEIVDGANLNLPGTLPHPVVGTAAVLVRAATRADIPAVVALHSEAFADKFGGAFGNAGRERGAAALQEAWQRQGARALRGMLLAEVGGQIVGTITLRTWEMGDEDVMTTELAFQQVLGLWGAMRSMFALSLLSHRIQRSEGYITDVAVDAAYRGLGIGRQLLGQAEQVAHRSHKAYLTLHVSSRNKNARTLYERTGFRVVQEHHSLLTWFFFNQRSWLYMRKDLIG